MVVNIDSLGGGGGGSDPTTEFFTPGLGQTVFNLAFAPTNPEDTVVRVNSVTYSEGSPNPGVFTVVGSVLTWLDLDFTLDAQDDFEVTYFV